MALPPLRLYGQAALALLKARREIRLVFIDIRMPGMSGPELADLIRSGFPEVKIVMTSGYTTEEATPGEFPFLQKPWCPNEVERAIMSAAG